MGFQSQFDCFSRFIPLQSPAMKKYLITSALPYINGVKHLGNLIGSLLPADVYARHLRQEGEEVLFICGTDEHGTPAEIAAEKSGESVEAYCQRLFEQQKAIYEGFELSFDYFGRSSAPENHALTQAIFKALDENGFIDERDIKQVYSKADGRFLPDRYVEGTCPHCGYEKARGDQCEACGRLLETTDLLNPYSAISGSHDLELRSTKHLFLKLDSLAPEVAAWVEQHPEWSTVTKGIAHKWLQEGLHERCISRDLKWGVKIPKAGFEDKVFYVWFDAPNAYISMTEEWAKAHQQPEAWKNWWCEPEQVNYTQFMAKDNVPFHAIFWPAMMLGTRQTWKLPDEIKSFNWLTYEGGKFSTSQQRGVFTDVALDLFPADYWRYYLLSIAPEGADSDFNFAQFVAVINKDLADILGNFVSRVMALLKKYNQNQVPEHYAVEDNFDLYNKVKHGVNELDESLRAMKFRQAAQQLRALWALGNEYITQAEPWKLVKLELPKALGVLRNCLQLIRVYAIVGTAFMPATSRRLMAALNEDADPALLSFTEALDFNSLMPGKHLAAELDYLFTKIDETTFEDLQQRF
ncbi:MAG TPA: methionine--tRNA ligase [Coxiellaceae bacterium]|nr:methionine--tRNA ligase [Coxiellaceae bacterium]